MSLGIKNPDELDVSLSSLMQSVIDDEPLAEGAIIRHQEGVDLLPSNIELSGMETGLFNVMSREYVLKNAIDGMRMSITQRGIKIKDTTSNEGQNAASYAHYQIVNMGDFAMNHMDLLTGWVDISQYEGVTSPDYRVFTLTDNTQIPEYFLRVFQMYYSNRVFYAFGQGAANLGRWRLPRENFVKIAIPCPPVELQRKIVDEIAAKVSKVDALIANQQAQIEKLKQYKQSLITEVVTKGLDPNAPMKDSNDMKSFRAIVTTATGPVFYSWVFGFGGHVAIRAPEDVKEEYAHLVLEAAEAIKKAQYRIPVRRNGMCLCPFHNDKNPSMKVDRRFHCFGCQADGDVIDFTAKLYGLTGKEAAVKLAADFGIRYDVGGHDPPVKKPVMPKISEELRQRQSEQKYFRPQRHGTVRADEHQPRQGLIRFTVKRIKRGVNGKEVPEGKSPVCLYPGENKTA